MSLLFVLLLGLTPDAAKAGAAYRNGLEALEAGRHEEAVREFREALAHEAAETGKLQYRDGGRRRKHTYFPHYEWGRARLIQASRETSASRKADLLREAVIQFGLTKYAGAPNAIKAARAALAEAEKAALAKVAPEDPFAGPYATFRRRVEQLCAEEQFEAAFSALGSEKKLFEEHEKQRRALSEFIRDRQKRVIERHEQLLILALDNFTAVDPITRGASVLPFLDRAQLPSAVQAAPAPLFGWARSFHGLYASELNRIQKATTLEVGALEKVAAAFETSAEKGLEAGTLDGFRAAVHVAVALRMVRLRTLARERHAELPRLLASSEKALGRFEEALRKSAGKPGTALPLKAAEKYRIGVLANVKREIEEMRTTDEARKRHRARIVASIVQAESSLVHPDTMANQAHLGKLGKDLAELLSDPAWKALPEELRARTHLVQAISEAIIGLLRGESGDAIRARCAAAAARAYALDGGVAARWKGRVSPRILSILNELKPK